MSDPKPRPPLASIAAIYAGIGLFCGSMMLSVFNLSIAPAFGILIGVFVALPFFALGMWLSPAEEKPENQAGSFWPDLPERQAARDMFWKSASVLVYSVSVIMPYVIFGLIFYSLPGDDRWATAIGRNVCIGLAILVTFGVRKFAWRTISNGFRGKVPAEWIAENLRDQPRQRSATVSESLRRNWRLPVISVVALAVAAGALDRIGPVQPAKVRGKANAMRYALISYQSYPNTVRLSAMLVFIGTFGTFVGRTFETLNPRDRAAEDDDGRLHETWK